MITIDQIRTNLQTAIKESGVKKAVLAQMLGIKQPTLSQYLSGRAMPALDTFANLCAVLDLDPAEILCLTDYGKTASNVHNDFRHNNGTIVNTFKQK